MEASLKKTLIDLLQKRMDKCTNEQFWAVATLSALDAFVLTHHKLLLTTVALWVPMLLITVPATYACWFIVQRHRGYYFYRHHLSELLKDEQGIPCFLVAPRRSRINTFSGVAFYVGIVLSFWMCVFGVLWYTSSMVEHASVHHAINVRHNCRMLSKVSNCNSSTFVTQRAPSISWGA